jgi:hypothetical protein
MKAKRLMSVDERFRAENNSMIKKSKTKCKFLTEREGQIKFFSDLRIDTEVELTHNTDGVYKGTLFEFKLTIPDINRALFQAIKYLSHRRIKGEPVPAQILLVALNEQNAYLFNSGDFLVDIEKIYAGAASKNNTDFSTKIKPEEIDYSHILGLQQIIETLKKEHFTKVSIDLFDVVGWANHFYTNNPKANKSQLYEELRTPRVFKNYIYPWKGKDMDFKYINDLLNAKTLKKELGAFYTPAPYCRKATELVRQAIKRLPAGHDYIILDRSAGTGNLEEFLTDKNVDDITVGELDRYIDNDLKVKYLQNKKNVFTTFYPDRFDDVMVGELEKHKTKISLHDYISDNEISHTIVNTYELKEWIVLNERLGDKVKLIIPPTAEPTAELVNGGDALSDHFVLGSKVERKFISKEYLATIDELNSYITDKKKNIILFENPPFRDTASNSHTHATKGYTSYVKEQLRGELRGPALNDLSNLFISSAYKYYLNKKDDYYILFSPIKYWKSLNLGEHKFINGYLFNRIYFHAGSSAISCILWQNLSESKEELTLMAYDINAQDTSSTNDVYALPLHTVKVKKAHNLISKLYDKYEVTDGDGVGVLLELDGRETHKQYSKASIKPVFNKSIIGYLVSREFGFDHPRLATTLVRCGLYDGHGFYLHARNYFEKLPLFAAGKYDSGSRWWEKGTIFKTSDGGNDYVRDKNFLKSCLIYTCLSYFNKCRSFEGSDGRYYRNELCFDGKTIANEKLSSFKLSGVEKELLLSFEEVLNEARKTENYNSKYAYGTYQIDNELNTSFKDENDTTVYDHPQLNTKLLALKAMLNKYYETEIQPKLFEYELLK